MKLRRSSSDAPLRIWPYKSCSILEKRQVRILPSEVSRIRLQAPQKAWVTGAMMPISPGPAFPRFHSEAVTAGGFAGGVGRKLAQGKELADSVDDLAQGNDHLRRPEAAFFEGHEFDESHDYIFFEGEAGEGFYLIVVEAAEEHAVDFDGTKAGLLSGANAAKDCRVAAGDAGDAFEDGLVYGVHADGDAAEACVFQGLGEGFEEMAVGGDGDVEAVSARGAPVGEFADHLGQVAAQERLAAGEADFFDAKIDEATDKAEVFAGVEFGELCADLAGAAVDALVVAAVSDGDAQVGDAAAVAVCKTAGKAHRRFDDLRGVCHSFRVTHGPGLCRCIRYTLGCFRGGEVAQGSFVPAHPFRERMRKGWGTPFWA